MKIFKKVFLVSSYLLIGLIIANCAPMPENSISPTQVPSEEQPNSTLPPPTDIPEPTITPRPQTRKPVYLDIPYIQDGHQSQRLSVYLPEIAIENPDQKVPTLFLVHGWSMSNDSPPQKEVINFVKDLGFAAITIDYRMGSGRDATWNAVSDGACALAWAYANEDIYGFDVNNLIAFGNSFGATIVTNLALSNEPQLLTNNCPYQASSEPPFKGVIIFGGWIYGVNNSIGGIGITSSSEDADEQERLKNIQPSNWMVSNKPPFLILHGDKDKTLKPEESETFAALLESMGISTTYMLLSDTGHSTWSSDETTWQTPIKQLLESVVDQ